MVSFINLPFYNRVKSFPYPLDGRLVWILNPFWALYRRRLLSVVKLKLRFFSRLARTADQILLRCRR